MGVCRNLGTHTVIIAGTTFSLFGQCTRASKGPGSPLPGRMHPLSQESGGFWRRTFFSGNAMILTCVRRGLHLPYSFRFLNIFAKQLNIRHADYAEPVRVIILKTCSACQPA